MTRLLVCGGRDYTNQDVAYKVLDKIHSTMNITHVINGLAPGADTLGRGWALRTDCVEPVDFPALWNDLSVEGAVVKKNKWGKDYNVKAGFQRNQRMLDEGQPHMLLAFPGGNGTADMVDRASKLGVTIILYEEGMEDD